MSTLTIAEIPQRVVDRLSEVAEINRSTVDVEARRALEMGAEVVMTQAVERALLEGFHSDRHSPSSQPVTFEVGGRLPMIRFDDLVLASEESAIHFYPEIAGECRTTVTIPMGRLPYEPCCEPVEERP